MSIASQQFVDCFQISPIVGETAQLKLITIRVAFKQGGDGSAVNEHIRLGVAPHLCKTKCNNNSAAVCYTFRDCLHQSSTLEGFFQIDKRQRRVGMWVKPGCFC